LKRATRCFALIIGLAAWAAAAGLAMAQALPQAVMAGAADCRFVVPQGMPASDVRWSGSCRGGWADGRGILRAYEQGKVVRIFYGRLVASQPVLGVIEIDGGFKAGRFKAGAVVSDADRDTLIQAFDEASAAAWQVAAGYRRSGNAASARYYSSKARQLSLQMD
jgi:hypothetical protein